MTLPVYITGTVSVSNLGTVVTGIGCMWSGINAREGDFFTRPDGVAIITEVTDVTHLKITPWPGATIAGGAYAIQQNYVGRVVGVAAAEDVGVMLEKLHVDGLPFIVGADETVPDPSYGDEGQMAFKPDTGAWWVKSGGVWVPSYGLTALGYGGTSATSILIATGPATFTTQSGLAYNGARVRAASAANLNNWMEGVATYAGTALSMTADKIHGSGTHADWLLSIGGQPGLDGTGTGDMMAVNNLSELTATAPTARKNIYAAPFDALAYNGMQVNGGGEVSQQNGSLNVSIVGTTPTVDGWRMWSSGAQVILGGQQGSNFLSGYPSGVQMYVNGTGNPSLAATDFCVFIQNIEGYRVARLAWGTANAQPLTIGFWIWATRPGMYSGVLRNAAANRSYVYTFTIAAATTWQWVTLTVPGDTTGTWAKDNTIGINLLISWMVGPGAQQGPLGWSGANYLGAVGTTNGVAGGTDAMIVTGLVVLPGIEAPSAARSPLIMRPYDQELVTCQRYYRKFGEADISQTIFLDGNCAAGGNTVPITIFHPGMRAAGTWNVIGATPAYFNVAGAIPNFSAGVTSTAMWLSAVGAGRTYWYTNAGTFLTADTRL